MNPLHSAVPKFDLGFCPTKKVEIIGIQRKDGEYYKYYFDHHLGKLRALECLECQPAITEQHLYPLYADYCKEISNYVIFTYNKLTMRIEQYVFLQATGGLEEVNRPEMIHDSQRQISEIVCTIKATETHGMTVIQRDEYGNFKKLRYINEKYQFMKIPSIYVRNLVVKKFEKLASGKEEKEDVVDDSIDSADSESSENESETLQNFYIQFCPKVKSNVICVRRLDKSYSRFQFNELTGDFDSVNCPECQGLVTEKSLYPYYAVYCDSIKKDVVFVRNLINFRVEQYIFSLETMEFEQVNIPELVFNTGIFSFFEILFSVNNDCNNGTIMIMRGPSGYIQKAHYTEIGDIIVIPAGTVRTLDIKRKEESDKMNQESTSNPIFNENTGDTIKNKYNEIAKALWELVQQRKSNQNSQKSFPQEVDPTTSSDKANSLDTKSKLFEIDSRDSSDGASDDSSTTADLDDYDSCWEYNLEDFSNLNVSDE